MGHMLRGLENYYLLHNYLFFILPYLSVIAWMCGVLRIILCDNFTERKHSLLLRDIYLVQDAAKRHILSTR